MEIATEIVEFLKEYDYYDFKDKLIGDEEDEIYKIASSLFNIESINQMIEQLKKFSYEAEKEGQQLESNKLEKIVNDLEMYKKNNSLDVLVLQPNKVPYYKTIINDLETIEREINGTVSINIYKDNLNIYYDNMGDQKELEPNRYINERLILGKFLIIAYDENGRRSLTQNEIKNVSIELKEYIKTENIELENGGKKLC